MAVRNIKLTIQYDGTDYHGWQMQPDVPTIQNHIAQAIQKLCGCSVTVTGASRTDAGVHALCQVANIQLDTPIPTENFPKAMTEILPDDIAVSRAEDVPMDFNAIGSARNKTYRYTLYTGSVRPVLHIRTCWHRPGRLDEQAMNEAAQYLVGEKDFKSLASAADNRLSSVRHITSCSVAKMQEWIYIDVSANGFLYNMVRNIVGTLVEVGRGRWSPEKMIEILDARDRTAAGPLAPASGLCLMEIIY